METCPSDNKAEKMLITFSGLDGSGKTSIINRVRREHPEFSVVHMVNSRLANRIIRGLPGNKAVGKTLALQNEKTESPGKKLLGAANLFFLFIDIIFFKLIFFSSRGPVICDRYFYDLLAVHIHRHGRKSIPGFILKGNNFFPKPDIAFLVEAGHENSRRRELHGSHSEEYFRSIEAVYGEMKSRGIFEVIENRGAEPPFDAVLRSIEEARSRKSSGGSA